MNIGCGVNIVKCPETFRMMVCELIHNAISMFPQISEYTITCRNEIGISTLEISSKGFQDPDPAFTRTGMGRITNCTRSYILYEEDLHNMYIAARIKNQDLIDYHALRFVCDLLYQNGQEPTMTTSFVTNSEWAKKNAHK
jgi:hypothetical protein